MTKHLCHLFYCANTQRIKRKNKLVPIGISAYYHQATGTFSITLSGIFLPMQIIYQDHTDHCHPKFKFPEEFNITYSVNEWSNEEKAIELIEKIFKRKKKKRKKEELDLRATKNFRLLTCLKYSGGRTR